ncbi:hypothetical protein M011DRAFT_220978 [Sporormia fimetaria CBS 119925]|uniref:Uncharacterized protein n=1 Tax=Sporormia fimetaria CBS 119925 TaxID=1340428 RepID=A0A6A6V2I5_9PLEO|nr:hypothetical protein M011DRAFT_220978 [Sporormia fimetaria CBS 119925]
MSGFEGGSWDAPSPTRFEIDSAVPEMWLPEEACKEFESAFRLTWNETLQRYLVDNQTHAELLKQSQVPDVEIFVKTPGPQSIEKSYKLWYWHLNLTLTTPIVDTPTYYFPLRRAPGPDFYMLGRTFLQATHVTVDFERRNFNLSEASVIGGSSSIVAIPSLEKERAEAPITTPPTTESNGLSSAAYAGIGIATGVVALIVAAVFVFAWRKKRWFFAKKVVQAPREYEKAEMHGDCVPIHVVVEAMGKECVELETVEKMLEAGSTQKAWASTETVEKMLDAGSTQKAWASMDIKVSDDTSVESDKDSSYSFHSVYELP